MNQALLNIQEVGDRWILSIIVITKKFNQRELIVFKTKEEAEVKAMDVVNAYQYIVRNG